MMILMNCDRTLRKKTEWEYQRNRNFVFGISSATILYSPLPHPFLGNCEMAVALEKKKKNFKDFFFFFYYCFYFLMWNYGITRLFKWTNGIMSTSFDSPSPSKCSIVLSCIYICFWRLFSMLNIMTVQYHKERLSRRRCRFFRIFERAITVHF